MPVETLYIPDNEVNRKIQNGEYNNDYDENDGYGNDEEGYGRSDEDEIRDDKEDNDCHAAGGSASVNFGEEEEGSDEYSIGRTRED